MEHSWTETAPQLSVSSWVFFTLDISAPTLFFTCSVSGRGSPLRTPQRPVRNGAVTAAVTAAAAAVVDIKVPLLKSALSVVSNSAQKSRAELPPALSRAKPVPPTQARERKMRRGDADTVWDNEGGGEASFWSGKWEHSSRMSQ